LGSEKACSHRGINEGGVYCATHLPRGITLHHPDSGLAPTTDWSLSVEVTIAIPEEAILRIKMIGREGANEKKRREPMRRKRKKRQ
jgi:hypothetical protein